MARKLFVAGATGAVGQVLLPLADASHVPTLAHVRAKSASKLGTRAHTTVELSDAPALAEAMKGCTTVLQLIGTMRKRFAAGDTYETSDIGTTRQLVEAAKASGTVDHVVLLSSVGAGRPFGAYLKAKAEAERIVRESGLEWTIVRPSAFSDREGVSLPGFRAVTSALGLHTLKPITLREVAMSLLLPAKERGPLGVALEGKALWEHVGRAAQVFGA